MPLGDLRPVQPGFSVSGGTSSSFGKSQSRSGARYDPIQQQRINRLYPQLEQRFQNTAIGTPQSYTEELQGSIPQITPQQIPRSVLEQSIYAQRAFGERQAQGFGPELARMAGGRGFAAGSPLLAQLYTENLGRSRAAATEGERLERQRWSELNAQLGMGTQGLELERGLGIANVATQREQQRMNQENLLLNALAFYNQPLPYSEADAFRRSRSEQFAYSQPSRPIGGDTGFDLF